MPRSPLALAAASLVLVACSSTPTPTPAPPLAASMSPPPAASSAPPALASSSPPPRRMLPPAPDAKPPADLGREACKRGEERGCDILAEYWGAREFLQPGREAEARGDAALLKEACEARKQSTGCMGLALMLKYGTASGKRDNEGSKPYWTRVRELGDLNGFRDAPSDEGKAALARVQRECDEGRPRSCNQAGWAAYNGVQRDKSIPDAHAAYAEACRLGSAQGCRWAGHYAHVYAEVKDLSAAEAALRRSCEGQNPGGCAELGNFLDQERGGKGSLELFTRACDGGSRDGCMLAGKKLLADPKERRAGAERLRLACDAEHEEACDLVAPLLEKGDSIKKDAEAALAAYLRGCQGKQLDSCAALARLASASNSRCPFDDKKPSRIGERGQKILKQACKDNAAAPWCQGVNKCP